MAKILIIDDEADFRELLVTMLESAGHEACTAADAELGLELSREAGIDLVILDIWMPGVDGITALKDLRAQRPALPVIVMSGGGHDVPLEHSAALADTYGAVQMLFKPFHKDELTAAVSAALEG